MHADPKSRRDLLCMRVAALLMMVTMSACAGSSSEQRELEPLIEDGRWDEVRARVEALRQSGGQGTWIDLAEGLVLLHADEDRKAEPLLRRVVAADSMLAVRVADAYYALAERDRQEGWTDRSRRRYVEAVRSVPTYEVGPQLDSVADYFYRFEKDYPRAFPLYDRLYRERPDPASKHREWVHRYGHCLELLGREEDAAAVYEEFVATWPDDVQIMRYVQWRHVTLLLKWAEQARSSGDLERALELAERAAGSEYWHIDLAQRGRYLAAEIEEARGRRDAARAWYEQVVQGGGRSSDDLIANARARLDAMGATSGH
jgi:tetratricopeptide (TPR) repeat protein